MRFPHRDNQNMGATPLGLGLIDYASHGSREARRPWALRRNRFAVSDETA
ncbi:MAG TPA: hypothetical protein VGQ39_09050 [Pyrinomonadaceae bacterium]|jgi:hypothetical protein|nr:hypothetical protein [Pyrinomonadaceae bacterium]